MTESLKNLGVLVPEWAVPPRPAFSELAGRYVRMERLTTGHAEDLHRANAADDRIWDYLPYGPFSDLGDYRAWVRDVAAGEDPMFFALRDLDSGALGGVASYLRISPDAGSIEVGHINLSAQLQGRRAATEAFFLMMEWAFSNGYRRFEWKCNALNIPSRRAAKRLGLSFEGIFRQAAVIKGRNRDTAWYAAIDQEWPALKDAFDAWLSAENFDRSGQQRQRLSDLTRPILVTTDPALETAT